MRATQCPGEGKLIIETANTEQGVSLTVHDTGHGMDAVHTRTRL